MTLTANSAPSRDDASRAAGIGSERLDALLARGVKVVRVIHADLFGRQRAKQFPVESLPKLLIDGVAYSKVSLAEDLLGVPVTEEEFPEFTGHPDLHAYIEPETAVIPPWEPDALWVLAGLWEGSARSPLCARGQLASITETMMEEFGYATQAAGEPEFYLFRPEADTTIRPRPYSRLGVSYTIDRITDPDGSVGRIHRALTEFGIGVTAVNREFSPGQFEINLDHGMATDAADQVFLLKTAIKELAVLEGLEAVFMAKPITGEEGSGLHVHVSLWEGGRNAFATGNGGLSDLALAAIAGIQAHAAGLLAFAAPTVNSYKRLRGNGLSPRTSNFAEDNRFTFLRVPVERGSATRLELRAGDASASSHLLIAALLHAARDGITRGLRPTTDGVPLPRSLTESLAALEADAVLSSGFGSEFVRVYTAIKRREIEAYEATVTDWEWNLYHSHI